MLVKASIAGAIVTNTLFMLGMSFLLGGLSTNAGIQPGQRAVAGRPAFPGDGRRCLIPSAVSEADSGGRTGVHSKLSVGLSVLLIVAYGLGMLFSLKTHRELFASAEPAKPKKRRGRWVWRWRTLAGVTVLVALVSEVFVESVQEAALTFGMSPAFVGFIVVALVGGAAEMASAFPARARTGWT